MTSFRPIIANKARFTEKVLVMMFVMMLGYPAVSARKPPSPPSSSPPTPSNFRVTATTPYTFTVAWNAATDNKTVSYDVANSASPQEWVTLPRNATNFTFSKFLYPLHSYSAIIRAVDSAGNASAFVGTGSANLPPDTTTPSTAPAVSVTDLGARHVRLAWTKPQDNDPSLLYKVFMNGSLLVDVGTNVTTSAVFLQPACIPSPFRHGIMAATWHR